MGGLFMKQKMVGWNFNEIQTYRMACINTRMGECYETFLATPHNLVCTLIEPKSMKKVFKSISNHPSIALKVFLLPTALPQGQLTEVPLKLNFSNLKGVGQTIQACSINKLSKF